MRFRRGFITYKGTGSGFYIGLSPCGAETLIPLPTMCLIVMSVDKVSTQDAEAESKRKLMSVVREMADALAHDSSQITETKTERDDMEGYEIDNPTSPGEVLAKRGVEDSGWGYEWNRIHVTVAASSIGTSRVMEIKRSHGLEVVDVWQLNNDMERDMGQHDEPAITFALE